jgi:hypothetical protein
VVSKAWKRLGDMQLVWRGRVGLTARVVFFDEDGSGDPYASPASADDGLVVLDGRVLVRRLVRHARSASKGGVAHRPQPSQRLLLAGDTARRRADRSGAWEVTCWRLGERSVTPRTR